MSSGRPPMADSMTLDAVLRSSNSDSRGDEALALHEHLQRLVRLRKRYDEALGRLASFASFAEYCEERLGMEVTHVERLAARARKEIHRAGGLAP